MSMPPYSQHPGRWGFRVSTLSILILSRPQAFRFQCFLSLDAILNNFAKLFSQVNYLECKMYLNLRFLSTSEKKKGTACIDMQDSINRQVQCRHQSWMLRNRHLGSPGKPRFKPPYPRIKADTQASGWTLE